MTTIRFLLICVVLLLAACGSQPSPGPVAEQSTASLPPTVAQPTDTPAPTAEPSTDTPPLTAAQPTEPAPPPTPQPTDTAAATEVVAPVEHAGLPLPTTRGQLFSASGACAACHTQMVDEAGTDVSTDTYWRPSMMANAARDPYWQASVRGEVLNNPDLEAIIEDKCATCHMPMAQRTAAAEGSAGQLLDDGFVDPANELHSLAMDGVSCTLCHQIREEGLGEPESYSGGFVIDTELPPGQRESFGPHLVTEGLAPIMQDVSGFIPLQSLHTEESALCATCHTLYTPFVDAEGKVAGVFPEQMAYFEWLASSFGGSISCQGCHMPVADGGVQLSITGGPPRSPFHQHDFVGGNAYMLAVLKTFGQDLAVTSSTAQFQSKEEQVVGQLQKRTAKVDLERLDLDGANLTANVALATMPGHKFPTGFPSRRAWIHIVVQDANGQVVFESGAVGPNGAIAGNDNDADPAGYEPHYLTIDNPDQVQIYESIIGDTEGQVTTVLLHGAGYVKDNRLLPAGFDKSAVEEDIAVHGAALGDEDFAGGGDRVQYTIDLGDAQGPFTVTAELLYQSIGYRWADNLRGHDAAEVTRFLEYYEQVPNQPVVVSAVTMEVSE